MDKSPVDDRRRYFRISDNLGVAYRVVADDHLRDEPPRTEPVRIFHLLEEQDELISQLLTTLRERDPLVADLARALNQKINSIVNQLEMESRLIEQIAHKVCEVNISACGLGFPVEEAIVPGTQVQLDLVLLPESRRLLTDALVVSCEPEGEGHYARMNFVNMAPRDQELLIQHIVKRQGDLLRSAREQAERMQAEPPTVPDEPPQSEPPKSAGV